jgi:ABC-2 type transport system ATP-binding protein
MAVEHVIETSRLTKVYGRGDKGFTALRDLDLQVRRGEIFGYLGPNGAGKTTTIRMLLDLIRPTRGQATILGLDARRDSLEIRRRVGFLPGELNLWRNERAIDIVKYQGKVFGSLDMAYVNQLAERFQFDLTKKMRDYSTGNKRKLGLILALMQRQEIVILDEPTSGLDPLMQQTFNTLMRDIRDEGRTVFLSSHVLSEVQAICDRVAVLRHGELKAVEQVEKLTHVDFRWVTLKFRDLAGVQSHLETVPGVSDVSTVNGDSVRLKLTSEFDPLLRAAVDHYVIDMRVQEPTLEEIFLTFYDDDQVVIANNNHTKERVS